MSDGTEFPTSSGRHHPGGGAAWKPDVPAQAPPGWGGTHQSRPELTPAPNGRVSGELPVVPEQQGGRAPDGRTGYPAKVGELPLAEQQRAPQRTRISFNDLEPADVPEAQRTVTAAPEEPAVRNGESYPNGLGVFDLGSVPASVTPPSTWRRAAWFAAASSGGVMGLLFAGTFLLSQQPAQPQATGDWTYLNRRGGAPLIERTQAVEGTNHSAAPSRTSVTGSPTRQPSPTDRSTSSPSGSPSRGTAGVAGSTSRGSAASAPAISESSATRATTSAPHGSTTTQVPEKPPPSPAETTVVNQRRVAPQHDAEHMAQFSSAYLNTVTENPNKALHYTTGELRAKGADGLRRKYAQVAYFEIQQVTVNQGEGITVNTVKTVYKDGHSAVEKVTLTFSENGKISHASR